jgi:hypothetical protein
MCDKVVRKWFVPENLSQLCSNVIIVRLGVVSYTPTRLSRNRRTINCLKEGSAQDRERQTTGGRFFIKWQLKKQEELLKTKIMIIYLN